MYSTHVLNSTDPKGSQPSLENTQTSQDHASSLSLLLQSLSCAPDDKKSLIPFIIMQYIASQFLEDFISASIQLYQSVDNTKETLITSCINSTFATAIIFFGEELAKELLIRLETVYASKFSLNLLSGNTWFYYVTNLFSGDAFSELKKNPELSLPAGKGFQFYSGPKVTLFNQKVQADISTHQPPFKTDNEQIEYLKHYLAECPYNFNEGTLTEIKEDIEANLIKTTPHQSHVYLIAATSPRGNITTLSFEHIFLLEQFYSPKHHEVRFRIYQSWIKDATLWDDFNKRHYGVYGENALTTAELNAFLDELSKVYNPNNLPEQRTYEPAFGYSHTPSLLTQFDSSKLNILSGLSLRYLCTPIDPEQTINHFIAFLDRRPQLKESMQQLRR